MIVGEGFGFSHHLRTESARGRKAPVHGTDRRGEHGPREQRRQERQRPEGPPASHRRAVLHRPPSSHGRRPTAAPRQTGPRRGMEDHIRRAGQEPQCAGCQPDGTDAPPHGGSHGQTHCGDGSRGGCPQHLAGHRTGRRGQPVLRDERYGVRRKGRLPGHP